MDSGIEVKFTSSFYHEARLDGLSMLVMDPVFMTMHFENRDDFLYYIHVDFAERTSEDQPLRVINKITEKYHRNLKKEANEDVAMAEFLFRERKLKLKYHYVSEHLTQSDRMYLKPNFSEQGETFSFDPALTSGYLSDLDAPLPKPLYLYRLEVDYFAQEEMIEKRVRERENEFLYLLRLRAQELAAPRLITSEFDIERNQDAKKAFHEREQQKKAMEERNLDMVCDYLAPYYAKMGVSPTTRLNTKMALAMVEECLQDWKNLMVARANDIQQQFEKTCQDIQEKNNWFEQNQSSITREQEEEYFEFCREKSYLLHILEVRLNRYKEIAPRRYFKITSYLQADPRSAVVFHRAIKQKKLDSIIKKKN